MLTKKEYLEDISIKALGMDNIKSTKGRRFYILKHFLKSRVDCKRKSRNLNGYSTF